MERVLSDISDLGVDVFDCPYKANVAIASRDGYIGIDYRKLKTSSSEKTVLCHELGHFLSGAFYNPSFPFETMRRSEERADRAAIRRYIPLDDLLLCFKQGVTERWEVAEHFGVTEDAIVKAYIYYRDALGCEFGVI